MTLRLSALQLEMTLDAGLLKAGPGIVASALSLNILALSGYRTHADPKHQKYLVREDFFAVKIELLFAD